MVREDVYSASESDKIKTKHCFDYGKSFFFRHRPVVGAVTESPTYKPEWLKVSIQKIQLDLLFFALRKFCAPKAITRTCK